MRVGLARAGLALVAVAGLAASIAAVARPTVTGKPPVPVQARGMAAGKRAIRDLDSVALAVTAAAPFRANRAAASLPYDPNRVGEPAAPPVEPTPKPPLVLAGIIWGTPPTAVLAGVPGAPRPRVIERGDTVAGLKVRRIERERVVITGYDTTWNLRVRELE